MVSAAVLTILAKNDPNWTMSSISQVHLLRNPPKTKTHFVLEEKYFTNKSRGFQKLIDEKLIAIN